MNRRKMLSLALAGAVVTLSGCLPGDDGGCPTCPGGTGTVRVVVPFETVAHGEHSGIRDTRMMAVRDEMAWAALWAEHRANQDPTPPVPEIDFAREMVVAFFWGEKPSSGHVAEIVELILRADLLLVRVEVRSPAPNGITLPVMTQPFHLVRAPRSEVPVLFEVREGSGQVGSTAFSP